MRGYGVGIRLVILLLLPLPPPPLEVLLPALVVLQVESLVLRARRLQEQAQQQVEEGHLISGRSGRGMEGAVEQVLVGRGRRASRGWRGRC